MVLVCFGFLTFANGAGMVVGGDVGVNNSSLSVTGVDAVGDGGQHAGGGVAENGGESDLEDEKICYRGLFKAKSLNFVVEIISSSFITTYK